MFSKGHFALIIDYLYKNGRDETITTPFWTRLQESVPFLLFPPLFMSQALWAATSLCLYAPIVNIRHKSWRKFLFGRLPHHC